MGNHGGHVIDLLDKPLSLDHVLLDSRTTTSERVPTTLTAGADYIVRPDGLALAMLPGDTTTSVYEMNGAQTLVRYSRDFLVHIENLPETWLRTGKTTAHDRRISVSLSTLRSSVFEELPT